MANTITGSTQDRINFAVQVILKGGKATRNFDNCFEMGDADKVGAGLYKRALKNPQLMLGMGNYVNQELCRKNYEESL
jgi:hypothetical protein